MHGATTHDCDLATARELERLEAHVQRRLGGQIRDLQLVLRDNGLILEGCTHTYYVKQLAQHALMETSRLPLLANQIQVL